MQASEGCFIFTLLSLQFFLNWGIQWLERLVGFKKGLCCSDSITHASGLGSLQCSRIQGTLCERRLGSREFRILSFAAMAFDSLSLGICVGAKRGIWALGVDRAPCFYAIFLPSCQDCSRTLKPQSRLPTP